MDPIGDINYLHILMIICLWGNHPVKTPRHTWEEMELCWVAPGVCEMLQGKMPPQFPLFFFVGAETSYRNKIYCVYIYTHNL